MLTSEAAAKHGEARVLLAHYRRAGSFYLCLSLSMYLPPSLPPSLPPFLLLSLSLSLSLSHTHTHTHTHTNTHTHTCSLSTSQAAADVVESTITHVKLGVLVSGDDAQGALLVPDACVLIFFLFSMCANSSTAGETAAAAPRVLYI